MLLGPRLMKTKAVLLVFLGIVTADPFAGEAPASAPVFNCYQPSPAAGRSEYRAIRAPPGCRPAPGLALSRATPGSTDGRYSRPPTKTLIWNADELRRLERYGFRPLVLAYNEPRFLFDFHSAAGFWAPASWPDERRAASKWFHQWSELTVR